MTRMLFLAAVLSLAPRVALTQMQTIEQRLTGSDPWHRNESFMPVGLISDMLVVGIPNDSESANGAGAVFVFKRNGQNWTEVQKILSPAAQVNGRFGWSLSVDEQVDTGEAWLAVGTPFEDASVGQVHLYARDGDTWVHQQSLTSEEADSFGHDVAINVDIPIGQKDWQWTLAIGAPAYRFDGKAFNTGAVFTSFLTADVWSGGAIPLGLEAAATANNSQIGYSVALDGDTLIAGAPTQQVDGQNSAGAVFVFTRGEFSPWAGGLALENPDAIEGEQFGGARFGHDVAITKQIVPVRVPTGNYVFVIGAPDDTSEIAGGQAYIWDGSELQRLTRPDRSMAGDNFGWAVTMRQDLVNGDHEVLISSRVAGDGANGAVFIYNQSDLVDPWLMSHHVVLGDGDTLPASSANVGQDVAAWDGWVAVATSNLAGNADAVYSNPLILHEDGFE